MRQIATGRAKATRRSRSSGVGSRRITEFVRAAALRAGYRVQRRDTPLHSYEHLAATARAHGLDRPTVIDVGVAEGTPELYRGFPDAHFLLVEPVREYASALESIGREYDSEYVIAAASDHAGSMELTVAADAHKSSLIGGAPSPVHERRSVDVVRLDDLCRERGLEGPFVVKVDVEGAELLVLDGAPETLRATELAILEVRLRDGRDDVPLLSDVTAYMAGRGFAAYDVVGAAPAVDGGLKHIDVAFVPEHGLLWAGRAAQAVAAVAAGRPTRH
jgi:FkbM family methyltransferase